MMGNGENKELFFGSFGGGHPFGMTHIQPIFAKNKELAMEAMLAQYERKWCSLYNQEQFQDSSMSELEWLPVIDVTEYGSGDYSNLKFETIQTDKTMTVEIETVEKEAV